MTFVPFSAARLKRSTEVRWFFEGEPSPEVMDWFHSVGGSGVPESARSDVYLRTGDPALNTKHREGRLEVKRRTGESRRVELAPDVTGLLEHWEKWSQEGAGAGSPRGPEDPRWIAVGKARRLCRFVPDGETVRLAHPDTPASAECNLELTRLAVAGQRWWSICFEAAGEGEEEVLRKAAAYAFSHRSPPPLDAGHSYSYARWLLNLGFGA